LTALEVAKSEYLDVFGNGDKRPSSALSNHTIRPVDSFASLASVYLDSQTDSSSLCSIDHFDIDSTIHQLLTSLRVTSPTNHRKHSFEHINYLESNLEQTTHQCDQIIQHFRDRINEATKVVNDLQRSADKIDALRDMVVVASQDKLFLRSISPQQRHRDSEDSQLTVFSHGSSRPEHTTTGHTSTSTQTAMSDHSLTHSTHSFNPTWLDRFIQSPNSTSYKSYLNELREVSELQKKDHSATTSPTKIAKKFKELAKKKTRLEEKIYDLHQLEAGLGKQHSFSSTSRVKAWLKRMVTPVQPRRRLEIVFDIDERNCFVGREVKRLQRSPTIRGDAIDASIDNALRNSQVVLEAVKRDLESIKKSFVAVNFYFSFLLGK
jgi:hypothetical protein